MPSRFDPLTWHIHEMLFGFVMAAVAGFLLTAIPNWTQRLPVSGGPLALLAGLWLLGRVACLVSALAAGLARGRGRSVVSRGAGRRWSPREIIAGRNWRNLPMVAPVTVLGIANLLMHLEADRRRRARWARLASRARRRDRADLGGGRADRAELHPKLAGEAPRSPLSLPLPGGSTGPLSARCMPA